MAYVQKTKEEKVAQSIEKLMLNVAKMNKEDYKEYLNLISKDLPHSYSFSNSMRVAAQFFAKKGEMPTVVGGAKSFFASIGRRVKKEEYGKHGLWILIPIMGHGSKEETDSNGITSKKSFKYIRNFRYGKVYDISQTEGDEYKPKIHDRVLVDKMDLDLLKFMDFLNEKTSLGINVIQKEDQPSRGGFVTPSGQIVLNSVKSTSNNKSTLLHELAHWFMGHTEKTCRLSREQKETDAETTAYCLGQRYGIEAESTQYVFGWSGGGTIQPNFERIMGAFNKVDRLLKEFLSVDDYSEK